jgi:hypothetical protein
MSNQPAFPSPYDDAEGMTLRDYFAAKALAPIIADWYAFGDMPGDYCNADAIAKVAYKMADAMLKARE